MSELMTLEDLTHYLRFTKKTVYGLLKQGDIPGIKIGSKWRFDKEVIDNWLSQNTHGKRAHILVIDDDETICFLFQETLKDLGHVVVTANSGPEGIQFAKQTDFDLVFLDLKLPGMNGAEILHELRSIKPKIKVTIITGYPNSEMMEAAMKEGPFGIMTKPFSVSDIIAAVDSFLHTDVARR